MRIEVTENRIEGWCDLPGWEKEQSVIAVLKNIEGWAIGSSMCLPADIETATEVVACYVKVMVILLKVRLGIPVKKPKKSFLDGLKPYLEQEEKE